MKKYIFLTIFLSLLIPSVSFAETHGFLVGDTNGISSGWTTTWQTNTGLTNEKYDTDGAHSAGVFTAPVDAIYTFNVSYYQLQGSGSTYALLILDVSDYGLVASSDLVECVRVGLSSAYHSGNCGYTIFMNAGDTVTFKYAMNSGSSGYVGQLGWSGTWETPDVSEGGGGVDLSPLVLVFGVLIFLTTMFGLMFYFKKRI